MNTDLTNVLQFLNSSDLFEHLKIEVPNSDFNLSKSVRIVERTIAKVIKNSIVLVDVENSSELDLSSVSECLVINSSPISNLGLDNCLIITDHKWELFQLLLKNSFANEPLDIDEMSMVYWNTQLNTVERTIFDYKITNAKESCIIGPGARIGVQGDFLYKDRSGVLRPMISIGGVKIGKNVVIGPNVVIFRGLTDLTEIEDNTIIEPNVVIHGGRKVSGHVPANTLIS